MLPMKTPEKVLWNKTGRIRKPICRVPVSLGTVTRIR